MSSISTSIHFFFKKKYIHTHIVCRLIAQKISLQITLKYVKVFLVKV
jgi:hypothetical protein